MNWKLVKEIYNGVMLESTLTNNLNEKITVEIQKIECDLSNKKSLMNLWVKSGFMPKALESYWSVSTEVEDQDGNCYRRYDLCMQENRYHKGKVIGCRLVIDFDWIMEATEENKKLLLEQVEKNFLMGSEFKRKMVNIEE